MPHHTADQLHLAVGIQLGHGRLQLGSCRVHTDVQKCRTLIQIAHFAQNMQQASLCRRNGKQGLQPLRRRGDNAVPGQHPEDGTHLGNGAGGIGFLHWHTQQGDIFFRRAKQLGVPALRQFIDPHQSLAQFAIMNHQLAAAGQLHHPFRQHLMGNGITFHHLHPFIEHQHGPGHLIVQRVEHLASIFQGMHVGTALHRSFQMPYQLLYFRPGSRIVHRGAGHRRPSGLSGVRSTLFRVVIYLTMPRPICQGIQQLDPVTRGQCGVVDLGNHIVIVLVFLAHGSIHSRLWIHSKKPRPKVNLLRKMKYGTEFHKTAASA